MKKFLLIALSWFILLPSCKQEDVNEIKESAVPAEALVSAIVEVYSTFDIIDDFISSSPLLGKKQESLLPDQVGISVLDSSFYDGDPAVVVLDFGSLGHQMPYGILCRDNKYRAGRLRISVSAPYGGTQAEVRVISEEEDPFYSGNGETMIACEGEIVLKKLDTDRYELQIEEFELEEEGETSLEFSCSNIIYKTEDQGAGILNDKVQIEGGFQMEDSKGTHYQATVAKNLRKNYTNSCISNIVAGELSIAADNTVSTISADFDPYNDMACDRIVSITINGKTVYYHY